MNADKEKAGLELLRALDPGEIPIKSAQREMPGFANSSIRQPVKPNAGFGEREQ